MTERVSKQGRLLAELSELIRSGELENGDRLPGEHALAQRYAVSRATVRQALAGLKREGLIATAPGAGSFVTFDGRDIDAQIGWSWSHALSAVRVIALLRFEVVRDEALAAELSITRAEFLAVDRVRATRAGERVTLERSRLPLRPELDALVSGGLRNGSLTESLVAAGVIPQGGEEIAELARLESEDAVALERVAGEPFLRLTSVVRDREGHIIERVVSLLDPDHFQLRRQVGGTQHVG